jgi:hypothetical protein
MTALSLCPRQCISLCCNRGSDMLMQHISFFRLLIHRTTNFPWQQISISRGRYTFSIFNYYHQYNIYDEYQYNYLYVGNVKIIYEFSIRETIRVRSVIPFQARKAAQNTRNPSSGI